MNRAELIKLDVKLNKAYWRAFCCLALVLGSMITTVMVSRIAGQPVNQQSIAEAGTPLIILFASIAAICQFFRTEVKGKIKKLEQ